MDGDQLDVGDEHQEVDNASNDSMSEVNDE